MDQTYSQNQTALIAQNILSSIAPFADNATVVALQGNLGAGKTTLTKSLAEVLGITETVVSPTFVIAKFYHPLRQTQGKPASFEHLIHMDAYRIESLDELIPLGWQKMLRQPNTLIVVEWPEKIFDALPLDTHYFSISHEGENRRIKNIVI